MEKKIIIIKRKKKIKLLTAKIFSGTLFPQASISSFLRPANGLPAQC